MRVGVTGGSGVVGKAVIRHLVEAGHEVQALARSSSSGSVVAGEGARPVPGDVLDPNSIEELVSGCELVFHVAGINELCSRREAEMWRVNVEGTRLVKEACRREGVRRLVFTSSAVTIGERSGEVGSESSQHRGEHLSFYERSKSVAEDLALSPDPDLEVVAVNPSSVQGPGRSTGTGELFLRVAQGRAPIAIDADLSIVDIDDCARGHLLAGSAGAPGRRYILSGAVTSVRELISLISEVSGRPVSPRYLKVSQARFASRLISAGAGLLRRQPPVCPESIRVVAHGHRYDGSRATSDLGLAYTSLEETVLKTVAWFRAVGLVA